MQRSGISVLLPTFNSAKTIRATLESVKWGDEILVVDSFSTDDTLRICREYDARIIQHEYTNSAKQKNWALSQCQYPWVLQIDTDEVLGPGLREDIEAGVRDAPSAVHAFRIPRKNHYLGKWVRHGGAYPDYQVRVFRRDLCRWREREVHAHIQASGVTETLKSPILHEGMPSLSKQLANLDRYTRYEADELRKNGRGFHVMNLLLRPAATFVARYIVMQGFRDGLRGFILAIYLAYYGFLSHAKLWEYQELGRRNRQ
jgi:glycosyltransferase involved in cell wall biosynthesis